MPSELVVTHQLHMIIIIQEMFYLVAELFLILYVHSIKYLTIVFMLALIFLIQKNIQKYFHALNLIIYLDLVFLKMI